MKHFKVGRRTTPNFAKFFYGGGTGAGKKHTDSAHGREKTGTGTAVLNTEDRRLEISDRRQEKT